MMTAPMIVVRLICTSSFAAACLDSVIARVLGTFELAYLIVSQFNNCPTAARPTVAVICMAEP
jgi:hypothetical protein